MAAFNFPNSPSTNDLHTENGVTYKWNGTVWKRQNTSYTDATNLNVTGISTFAGNITANGNIVGDNSTNISGINDVIATSLYTSDSIIHRGETGDNTKIRFPADDTVTVETNGSERLRIDSSGKVVINKNSGDFDGALHVKAISEDAITIEGSNAAINWRYTDGSAGYRGGIKWHSNGLVKFDAGVSGNSYYYAFHLNNGERLRITSSGDMGLGVTDATILNDSGFREFTIGGTSEGAAIHLQDVDGNVKFGIFTSDVTGAGIIRTVTNHPLHFRTNNTERLRITSNGDVTIPVDSKKFLAGAGNDVRMFHDGSDSYFDSITGNLYVYNHASGNLDLGTAGNTRFRIGSGGEVSLRRGGISATPAFEIYGSGNAGDADADNLRFHTWGNSSGDYWDVGVNHGLDGSGNNTKPSTTLKGAAIRFNAKNGKVTLITSPASTSTQYEGLTQNELGHITTPQQPVFHVQLEGHKNADQNPLKFTDIRVNNGSHYNSSTGRFTAPTAGMYFFFMEGIKNSNLNVVTRVYIQKNGSYIYDSYHLRIQEEGYYADGCTNWIVSLAANDYITVRLQAGGLHAGEYTHFGGYLIG